PARGAPGDPTRGSAYHRRLQSFQSVWRPTLLRTRPDHALDRQFHRTLPAQGLALAARLRSRRWPARLLRAAVRAGKMAAALRILRESRGPLVADRGRWVFP